MSYSEINNAGSENNSSFDVDKRAEVSENQDTNENKKFDIDKRAEPTKNDMRETDKNAGVKQTQNEELEAKEKNTEIQMPKITVCFKYPNNCDINEYNRQLKGQQEGMNKLSIAEFLQNRENYELNGRTEIEVQKEYREKILADRIEANRNNGMSYEEAKEEAQKWISDKDVLHEPDQIAGGNPQNVSDIGSSSVNASIGAQWKGKIQDVDCQIKDFAKNLSNEEKENFKLNVELKGVY